MTRTCIAMTLGMFLTAGAFAQSQQYGNTEAGKRRYDQQQRIANGVQDGQLTSHETANLEHKEAGINHQIAADRSANGGALTPAEKAQVNREQNGLSRQIYTDKHNAATQKFSNTGIGARRENQQDRIAQGIRSGSLTPGETTGLERQQARIAGRIGQQRAANGGPLTPAQRRQDNKALNRSSNRIYRKKHN